MSPLTIDVPNPRVSMPSEILPQQAVFRIVLIEGERECVTSVRSSLDGDPLREFKGTFDVVAVKTLPEALEQLATSHFSAILLGLLNDGDLQNLKALRKQIDLVPVVTIFADGCESLALAAMRSGADDCLLISKMTSETLPRALRSVIEHRLRLAVQTKLKAAWADVSAAEVIQHRLLPRTAPIVPALDLSGICIPAETIGGDLFDFLYCDETRCLGVVADVSGHGLPAGILMTELHGLLHGLVDQNLDLVRISAAANRRVLNASQCRQFITMLLYQLDTTSMTFSYVSAGHPGWIIHRDGTSQELSGRQLPLGVDLDLQSYQLDRISIQSGDLLVLPTDGVFEPRNGNQEMFGIDRMLQVAREQSHRSADQIVSEVVSSVCDFSNSPHLSDDCTLVIIKVE